MAASRHLLCAGIRAQMGPKSKPDPRTVKLDDVDADSGAQGNGAGAINLGNELVNCLTFMRGDFLQCVPHDRLQADTGFRLTRAEIDMRAD